MKNFRQISFEIVYSVFAKNSYSDELLRSHTAQISDRDKKLIYSIVKGTIKRKRYLDFILNSFIKNNTSKKIRIFFHTALYQIIFLDSLPNYAVIDESVQLSKKIFNKKVSKFINAVLRNFLRKGMPDLPKHKDNFVSVKYSFPLKFVKSLFKIYSLKETEELLDYYNRVPRLHLRVNSLEISRSELSKIFVEKNIAHQLSPFSSNMITTSDKRVLFLEEFANGLFSIQDSSAALVPEILNPQKNEIILDMFAGPGGKCSYIAELMKNTGKVIACDKFPKKTKKIMQAAKRLNFTNIYPKTIDSLDYFFKESFDKILLDVPCSGWGVFQKKAELRWQKQQDIKSLLEIQRKALNIAAQILKSKGTLVYSTCTINPEENENQIKWFLDKFKNFKLEKIELENNLSSNSFLKPFPPYHQMDGSFAAKLIKS